MTTFPIVFMSVEDFFCDLPCMFQISLSIIIVVFDLKHPWLQDQDFVNLVCVTVVGEFRFQSSLKFLIKRSI